MMTRCYEQVVAILEQKIGHSLAESVIHIKCANLGIRPETISPENLPALADELYEPLRLFGGEEFARVLITRIRELHS
jgi:hypothetical protein